MSTDYQILLQKFGNFKTYIKSVSSNHQVIQDYENMTDNEFLLFGLGFLVPNKGKLDLILEQISNKLNITEKEQREKIKRYLECFIEYLIQINNPDVLKDTILNVASEKGVNIPSNDSSKINQ
jgi:hypothetical protein